MNIKLFELREYNNLSQLEIGEILGVVHQTYSRWENSVEIVPLKHVNTLSNYYNVSMDYLLGLSNKKNSNNFVKLEILDKKDIGLRIKRIRAENNLTLRRLAAILNTTSSTISAYETGKTLILTAFAYQICKNFNYSIDWLCGKIN